MGQNSWPKLSSCSCPVVPVQLFNDSGKPRSVIARDLGVSTESLGHRIKQLEIDRSERAGISTDEGEELKRLRRVNRILREEREILKKATAFFARET
jgi:transposase